MAETAATDQAVPREQDRYLPIANIGRIMKRAIPPNAKIAKDARDIVQECVSEFISFITSEASDKCARQFRYTGSISRHRCCAEMASSMRPASES